MIFVRRSLSFSELFAFSLSSLDSYADYVKVNISLKNFSLSFLNVNAPLFALFRRITQPTPFLSPFPLPEIFSMWGTSTAITPSRTQKVLPTSVGRNCLIGSSLTFFPLMILAYLLFSIAPPLMYPLFPPLSLCLASGRCFRTWVQITYQSTNLPSFSSYPPQQMSPSFVFQKARWNDIASYFDSHFPLTEEYSSLSLFSAALLFTFLTLNAAKSSIFFGRIQRQPKAWWSAEVEEAVSEIPLFCFPAKDIA